MDKVRFPLDRLEEIEQYPENFKLLERVPLTRADMIERLPIKLLDVMPNERVASVVFLDTETTGINPTSEKIIELGMVKCAMSLDRKCILSIDRIYDDFEDPKRPIPPEITKLTGITDDMVRGHSFDQNLVLSFFADSPLVVAHNAKFDRPFFDRRFTSLSNQAWACSQNEIDWKSLGFGGAKLEFLVQSSGFFYDAHRAVNDCLSLCYLLHIIPEAFEQLVLNSMLQTYRLDVSLPKNDYGKKDDLKAQKYRWDSEGKTWYIQVTSAEEAIAQVNFLKALNLKERDSKITVFSAKDRYIG